MKKNIDAQKSAKQNFKNSQFRPHSSMSGKAGAARSWHPSPLPSDDENEEHHFFQVHSVQRAIG